MTAWRVVNSLLVLRDQINALAPNRSKASDGTIGDLAHQSGTSDHNPATYPGLGSTPVVCALDVTQDPAHGADMGPISEALRTSRDRRIGYVIFNRRITGPNHGWAWDSYSGSDPHTSHMHVSTVHTSVADDTSPWRIGAASSSGGDDDVYKLVQMKDEAGGNVYLTNLVFSRLVYATELDVLKQVIGWTKGDPEVWGPELRPLLGVRVDVPAAEAGPVDVKALAAALAPQLAVDQAAVVAALQSPEGQAALVRADNTAEDS